MDRQILVAGELAATFIALPEEDLVQDSLYARRLSGTLKVAQALRQLEIPCAAAGKFFTDPLGFSLLKSAELHALDTRNLLPCKGRTAFSVRTADGQVEASCPADPQGTQVPAFSLSPCAVAVLDGGFVRDPLGQALYDQCVELCARTDAPLILCCLEAMPPLPEDQLGRAQILYLEAGAAAAYPSPAALLRGRTQAVLVLDHQNLLLTTRQGTQKFSNFDPSAHNEPALGAAALAWMLYSYEICGESLESQWSHPAFVQELVYNIQAAWHTPSSHLEKLRAVLHANRTGHHLLSLAQHKMDAAAPRVAQSPWRLQYHISAPSGWINDPNGLIQMDGVYHVFYQLHPFSPEWGPMYWGHVTSRDLAHWHQEPIALAPDQPYEAGCFSGSAVNDNGVLTLLYTAHNDGNDVKECQCLARSCDGGRTFEKYPANPVIPKYPKDGSPDFRDPKVWRQDGQWQMVVGTSKHKKGRVLLYSSRDLEHWDYRGVLCESDGTQGEMWECPNFCTIDGQDVLIYSPMGMKGHKNIYSVGRFDCAAGKFYPEDARELDYGTNFYAAQVFEDEQGRTLLIAWMDAWGTDFPSQADGWAGALTLPRVLRMRGKTLLQQPAPELSLLRKSHPLHLSGTVTRDSNPLQDLRGNCLELLFRFSPASARRGFQLCLLADPETGKSARLLYDGQKHAFAFPHGLFQDREKFRADYIPCREDAETVDVHIFVDRCSVEVFIDQGALCFTQRVYPTQAGQCYALTADGLELSACDAWLLGSAFSPQ